MGAHASIDTKKRQYGRKREAAYRARLKAERPEEYQRQLEVAKERSAKWREANPEKVAANNKKHRQYRYGLTVEDIAKLFALQNGRCALCEKELQIEATGKWVVDHNHQTGKIRGVLCYPCNVALGQFQDDPRMLIRAIEYLHSRPFQ